MITDNTALGKFIQPLRNEGIAALDTEFVWRDTARARMALVQLADAAGESAALDCLEVPAPEPLAALLRDAGTVKILHDAQQDLWHLRHFTGAAPVNVFDTQLAAAFCGCPRQVSLQKLVQETLGVELPKTETVSNWCRRPLTPAQVDYALDDVRYLGRAREILRERAARAGTREWMEEDMKRYDDPELYAAPEPRDAWRRVKCGRVRLDAAGYGRLRALAATREEMSQLWDLPKSWLTEDGSLAEIAANGDLRFRHRLPRKELRGQLTECYTEALKTAEPLDAAEIAAVFPRYSPETLKAADAAMEWLKTRAGEMGLEPGLIANRAAVTAWVATPNARSPLARGWRHEHAGREIAEKFRG